MARRRADPSRGTRVAKRASRAMVPQPSRHRPAAHRYPPVPPRLTVLSRHAAGAAITAHRSTRLPTRALARRRTAQTASSLDWGRGRRRPQRRRAARPPSQPRQRRASGGGGGTTTAQRHHQKPPTTARPPHSTAHAPPTRRSPSTAAREAVASAVAVIARQSITNGRRVRAKVQAHLTHKTGRSRHARSRPHEAESAAAESAAAESVASAAITIVIGHPPSVATESAAVTAGGGRRRTHDKRQLTASKGPPRAGIAHAPTRARGGQAGAAIIVMASTAQLKLRHSASAAAPTAAAATAALTAAAGGVRGLRLRRSDAATAATTTKPLTPKGSSRSCRASDARREGAR